MFRLIRVAMLLPVHLDRQPRSVTVEIEHIGPDGMLAAEFQAAQSLPP
jgi:hypothetical protein